MTKRRAPKKQRRSKTTRTKRANATRGKSRKPKRPTAQQKKRSAAAKKGWAKRRRKQRLIDAMHDSNWREIALPTRDELYDYMTWMSDQFEIEISDMYRLYFGYEAGETIAAE